MQMHANDTSSHCISTYIFIGTASLLETQSGDTVSVVWTPGSSVTQWKLFSALIYLIFIKQTNCLCREREMKRFSFYADNKRIIKSSSRNKEYSPMNQAALEWLQWDREEGARGEIYFSQIAEGRSPISEVLLGCHHSNTCRVIREITEERPGLAWARRVLKFNIPTAKIIFRFAAGWSGDGSALW